MFDYHIKSLIFSGGQEVRIGRGQVVALAGANNCGKSQGLKDIEQLWNGDAASNSTKCVSQVNSSYTTNSDEFLTWLAEHYSVSSDGNDGQTRFTNVSGTINLPRDGQFNWFGIRQVASFLVLRLDTESRLQLTKAPKRTDPFSGEVSHFIHYLQSDNKFLEYLNTEVKETFGLEIALDYAGGQNIALYVGARPKIEDGGDRVHPEYVRKMRAHMQPLDEAGDGLRSYIGIVGSIFSEAQPVILIDEPEAFLHPPQARRLGRVIGNLAREKNKQVILATHSAAVLQGLIAPQIDVSVCRVQRSYASAIKSVNNAYHQKASNLRDLWEKPLLRSSAAIDGVFHQGVVVTEGDSDLRFYESIIAKMDAEGEFASPPDFHFVHGGGKQELTNLAKIYIELHVPVAVVPDFDIFREKNRFRTLCETFGIDFSVLESDYNAVASALKKKRSVSLAERLSGLLEEAEKFLTEAKSSSKRVLSSKEKQKLSGYIKEQTGWEEAKRLVHISGSFAVIQTVNGLD